MTALCVLIWKLPMHPQDTETCMTPILKMGALRLNNTGWEPARPGLSHLAPPRDISKVL